MMSLRIKVMTIRIYILSTLKENENDSFGVINYIDLDVKSNKMCVNVLL